MWLGFATDKSKKKKRFTTKKSYTTHPLPVSNPNLYDSGPPMPCNWNSTLSPSPSSNVKSPPNCSLIRAYNVMVECQMWCLGEIAWVFRKDTLYPTITSKVAKCPDFTGSFTRFARFSPCFTIKVGAGRVFFRNRVGNYRFISIYVRIKR